MKLHRRKFLHLGVGAAALPALSRFAFAQPYPTRPVRWIVGFPPGGGADGVARIVGQWLSERLGQRVIIENRPGAGASIAAQTVLNSQPDGYTLLLVGTSNVVNTILHESPRFNLLRDIEPVGGLTIAALVMMVNASVPATTLAEFVAYARANPGKLRMGSYGIGTQSHLAVELFKAKAGVDVIHVPYRGGATLAHDLSGEHVQVAFDSVSNSLPAIKSGALRALAVTAARRLAMLPDVPAVAETLPGYEMLVWTGIGARKGTPPEVIERLSHEIRAGLADPGVRARLADYAVTPLTYGPGEFGAYWVAEAEKLGNLVRAADIRVE